MGLRLKTAEGADLSFSISWWNGSGARGYLPAFPPDLRGSRLVCEICLALLAVSLLAVTVSSHDVSVQLYSAGALSVYVSSVSQSVSQSVSRYVSK